MRVLTELIGGGLLLALVYLGIGKVVSFINARKELDPFADEPSGEKKDQQK